MTDTELCANCRHVEQCDGSEYECPAFQERQERLQQCPDCEGTKLVLHPLLDSYFPCPKCTELRKDARENELQKMEKQKSKACHCDNCKTWQPAGRFVSSGNWYCDGCLSEMAGSS